MTLSAGDTLPEFRVASVDPEAMKLWAELLHDPNPLHLDRAAVKAAGLGGRRINQGPANLAYVINMLHAAFPGGWIAALDARYTGNVLEGDIATAGGTVVAVGPDGIDCELWLDVEERGRMIAGTARIREKE